MITTKEIAILRLAIDMIKTDNKIHCEEISWVIQLSKQYKYSQEEIQAVHNITFRNAIETIRQLDTASRNEIIDSLREIVSVDNNIDTNERILLTAILMSLHEDSCQKVQIITADARCFENFDKQLIYLNQRECNDIIQTIGNNYTSISRQLKHCDIEFFFFPHIIHKLSASPAYIKQAIELLLPTFSQIEQSELGRYTTSDYCAYIRKIMGEDAEPFKFDAFVMIKIQSSHHYDNHTVDFLCIDCTHNPLDSINRFIDHMDMDIAFDTLPFHGCYRTLLDMISQESKLNYNLLLEDDIFYLYDNHKKIALDIRGTERKTLFTLFLLYGREGINNHTFAQLDCNSQLGQDAITIYRYFANEKNYRLIESALNSENEPSVIVNLRDITKRISHIGFIKKAFSSVASLKSPENYYPVKVKGEHTYNISLPLDKIRVRRYRDDDTEPLNIHFFK